MSRPALASPPPRMSVSECCRQLGLSRDTYYRHRLDEVFTRFESPGGRPLICRHEVFEYQQFRSAAKARAAVLALRKRLGRVG
ncbi:MAG: hypothetical protein U0804_28550 [Gemmataceae bacterium]